MSQLQARSEDNYWQDDPSHQVPRRLEASLPSKSIQHGSPNKDTVYATQSSDDCILSVLEKMMTLMTLVTVLSVLRKMMFR